MLNNTAVIVLGMHRSGTSALAGMLSLLGIQFGRSLFPPQADNPRGFWEHKEIVDLDDRMLMTLGSSWDDMRPLPISRWTDERVAPFRAEIIRVLRRNFATAQTWGIKDPRICRLVPLWCDMLDELGAGDTFTGFVDAAPLTAFYSGLTLMQPNAFQGTLIVFL